jgi:hypothetical protein
MKTKFFISNFANIRFNLLMLLCLPMVAQAGIVRTSTLINQDTYEYTEPLTADRVHTSDVTGGAAAFSSDFSALGASELTHVFLAPIGMRFRATFAEEGIFYIESNNGSSYIVAGQHKDLSPTIIFSGLGGSVLPAASNANVSITGPKTGAFTGNIINAGVNYWLAAGADFWFESVSITTQIPASFNTNLSSPAYSSGAKLGGRIINSSDTSLGQFVRLEDIPPSNVVPAPATWLLMVFGCLMLRISRRR